MKLQTLNENLIKALSGIKENQVNICNVIVNRKILLETLKLNKVEGLAEIETGKTTWHNNREVYDRSSLRLILGKQTMTFFGQKVDYKNPFPAKIDFTGRQSKQGLTINSNALLEALTYVMPCMATEQDRPSLNCVLFDSKDGILKLVTADGYRLAKIQLSVAGIPTDKTLIHQDDIKKLMSFLKGITPNTYRVKNAQGKSVSVKEYPDITMEYRENTVRFYSDKSAIEFENLAKPSTCYGDGMNFPDYEQLIPDYNATKLEFFAKDMLQAVKSLKNIASNGSGTIRLQFFKGDEFNLNGKCLLSAKSEELGANAVEIDCKVSQDCKIALDYRYLIDYLSLEKGYVSMYVTTTSSPAKFELDNKTCVIMPMFVQWDNEKSEPIKVESAELEDENEPNPDELEVMDAINNDNDTIDESLEVA